MSMQTITNFLEHLEGHGFTNIGIEFHWAFTDNKDYITIAGVANHPRLGACNAGVTVSNEPAIDMLGEGLKCLAYAFIRTIPKDNA